MTKISYYIFGVLVLILISVIGYQQFSFNKQLSSIQKELIESRKDFSEYKDKQNVNTIKIITEITESNNKKFGELYEKLENINDVNNANNDIINKLRKTTTQATTNYYNLTDDTKKRYNETLSELLVESTELLNEIAREADRSTEAAITYHELLVEYKRIVDEANSQ